MRNTRKMAVITMFVGIFMISLGMFLQTDNNLASIKDIIKRTNFRFGNFTMNATGATNTVVDSKTDEKLVDSLLLSDFTIDAVPASFVPKEKNFSELSLEEAVAALNQGILKMEYSAYYTTASSRLTKSKGAQYFNGHKETYYSQKVLPGNSLRIPGRHVADDGTIRDADGFICVAANPSFMSYGSILITSLGPAKVYDSGCSHGIIDLYVNW